MASNIQISDDGDSSPEKFNAQNEGLREWFEEYMSIDANKLGSDHHIFEAVDSDELDEDSFEQRISNLAATPILGRFCIKCQELFDNWPTLGNSSTREHDSKPGSEGGWEHTAVRPCNSFELEASTRVGCKFCAFLIQRLKDRKLIELFRKIENRLLLLGESSISFLSIQNWGANPTQLLWLNLPGKICTSNNAGTAPRLRFVSHFLPLSVDCHEKSSDVFSTANDWLSHCIEKHEACKSNSHENLPTRLICVAEESPRLVFTADYQERLRYAALSHSWGSHRAIVLTSENIGQLTREISMKVLPKTFKDAIKITQKLGIDYLWIDSLCIIQNDDHDWQEESALMSSVYGGSSITIAASSARDSTEGCFLEAPNFSGGLRVRINDGGRQRVQDFLCHEEYNYSTLEAHLGTRAWALQEKILPLRTVHFGDRGAFWECRSLIASEFFPDGFRDKFVKPLVCRTGMLEWKWHQIVKLYSAANLTYGKDKLPALSGIAKSEFDEHDDQYLAGMWREKIEEQLCWGLTENNASERPLWRAPSWSWTSIDGQVAWPESYHGSLNIRYAHVVDAGTTPYGHNPFGQVIDGFIRLACSTMAVGHIVHTETFDEAGYEDATAILLDVRGQKKTFPCCLDCLDDVDQNYARPIYLVPVIGGKGGSFMFGSKGEIIHQLYVFGIVLRNTNSVMAAYIRIGSFCFRKYSADWKELEFREPFLQALEEQGLATAETACSEILSNVEPPDHRYLITIL
ncbi:putative heterokaryon incompatibility protein [Botrytis fragariae]|uniref:Putative heterokaryon incompatibility protein n=1 Tax=Botrytis fragariae TaxID=1964551 RepID=A0A8H6EDT2_9HELO|nr:putative heterokaryon incompatibility protein [Botrytis fragariae]KAF5868230.1 putative heterokaryon incompatibility protein [Botrytis fragariae]